jgi:hypothetical protein
MATERTWRQEVTERFPARQTLAAEVAFELVWATIGVPRSEVDEVLALLELEYGIEPGFFRPEDRLEWLLQVVPSRGFWSHATNKVRAGDRELVLADHLQKRCNSRGVPIPRDLVTRRQFVEACSGIAAT